MVLGAGQYSITGTDETKSRSKTAPQSRYHRYQSAEIAEAGGEHGFDGAKKVHDRKRHILVDSMGNLLKVFVHAATHRGADCC
jgi:hypothetical protein